MSAKERERSHVVGQAVGLGTALRGAKVTLHHAICGSLTVHYNGRLLPVTAYGRYSASDAAVYEKTLDAHLYAIIAARHVPSQWAVPSRRG